MAPTTPIPKPRLLLADDHQDLLNEIAALLDEEFEVIGMAHDGVALVNVAAQSNPDVVITDLRMPRLSGIAASSTLLERGLCKAVVLLTEHRDRQLVDSALKAGIRGFVLKMKAAEDLIPAIHSALRGETFVSSLGADGVS